MSETGLTSFGKCSCGAELPSIGATRCLKCQAAHARSFIRRRAELLNLLPERASASEETTWVACNMGMGRVDLELAPSRSAVNLLDALNRDASLRRAFWSTFMKLRLRRAYS